MMYVSKRVLCFRTKKIGYIYWVPKIGSKICHLLSWHGKVATKLAVGWRPPKGQTSLFFLTLRRSPPKSVVGGELDGDHLLENYN